ALGAIRHLDTLCALARVPFGPTIDPFAAQTNRAVPKLHVFESAGSARVVDRVDTDSEVAGRFPWRHPRGLTGISSLLLRSHDRPLSAIGSFAIANPAIVASDICGNTCHYCLT